MTTVILVAGITAVFLAILLSLTAIGVLTNEDRGVSRSLAVLEAFTTAPKAMQQELDKPFNDRVLAPLLDRTLTIGRRLTPADYHNQIRTRLEQAGNPAGWTVDRVISMKFVGFAVALTLALLVVLAMGLSLAPAVAVGVLAAVLGYLAPNFALYQMRYNRTEQLQRSLADALDLLTISVESGLGFDAALAHVAKNTEGPLAHEFARMLQEMQIGRGRSEALRGLAERTTVADLKGFVSAMVQADAFGIPMGKVLRVQSSEIRVKRRQWAEEQAQKVPVKILIPLIFCILPCLFIAVLGPAGISMMENFAGGM